MTESQHTAEHHQAIADYLYSHSNRFHLTGNDMQSLFDEWFNAVGEKEVSSVYARIRLADSNHIDEPKVWVFDDSGWQAYASERRFLKAVGNMFNNKHGEYEYDQYVDVMCEVVFK